MVDNVMAGSSLLLLCFAPVVIYIDAACKASKSIPDATQINYSRNRAIDWAVCPIFLGPLGVILYLSLRSRLRFKSVANGNMAILRHFFICIALILVSFLEYMQLNFFLNIYIK